MAGCRMWAQDRFLRLQGLVAVACRQLTDAQVADLIRSLRSVQKGRSPDLGKAART
jgi:hypothetical protein